MAVIDLTDPLLALEPVPQSTDVEICQLTFSEPIAADDKLAMYLRESIGGPVVGKLTSKDGNFGLNVTSQKVSVRLTEKTAKWFKDQAVTDANRVRTLTGTLLHETVSGASRLWSGLLDIKFAFALSWTRD